MTRSRGALPSLRDHSSSDKSSCNLAFMDGSSRFTTDQVSERSISKYLWIKTSLIPAICFQGISGFRVLNDAGIFFTASPIISRRRMIASCKAIFFLNLLAVSFSEYCSINSIDSIICSTKTSGSFFTKSRPVRQEFVPAISYKSSHR